MAEASRGKIVAAFAAVYVIWGSTYLAILYAIETLPPFLMAATRFLIAGTILFGWSILRAERRPTRAEWKAAAVVGALLLMGGNGAVVWAEQLVPSGVAALLVSVTPCWMVLLDWLWHGSRRPGMRTVVGLVLGFGGIVLLIGPSAIVGGGNVHPLGALVLMIGCLCWAVGSLYSKRAPRPPGALLSTGMQMLAGGSLLVVAGLLTGEASRLDMDAVSMKSLLAVLYLIVFGAIIGYSAYVWLLRVVSPARVSTYAYVNPVVAVLLGWGLAGEALTARMGIAGVVIIGGVALITIDQG
ncbi:MAG TPA: EamA family transporter [Longimicrobiales bacterium]|nr:EamA family transporter [Longimicrobiales bacterium]